MNQSTSFSESEAASKLADATKKLMEALPRSSQSLLSDFKFNDDESVQMTATQLVEFMDSLNRVRKYKLDHERAKGIVRTLFTAVYPFLKASLQAGSLVVQVVSLFILLFSTLDTASWLLFLNFRGIVILDTSTVATANHVR
jgi:hypothetical protein